ncbi:MerR family transcriptional regulator [Myxococcota bacterium]|nr:MerR family transcriptional regulator [Myxococcota bacterium]
MDGERKGLLTSGDLARLTRNTVRTVRFYEERGLLVPSARSSGGHRLYTEDQVKLLEWISALRDAGIPLGTMSRIIELRRSDEDRHRVAREIRELLGRELAELQRRVEVIQTVQDELTASARLFAVCAACKSDGYDDECESCEARAKVLPKSGLGVLW